MLKCLRLVYVGNLGSYGQVGNGRTVFLNPDYSPSNTFAQALVLDESISEMQSCEVVGLSGTEYRALVSSLALQNQGTTAMSKCLKLSYLGNLGSSNVSRGRTVLYLNGSWTNTYAQVAVFDESSSSIDSCELVALSGSEYQSIVSSLSVPAHEVNEVNVTADIFVGCLLVLCLIGGWIAGGQR